MDSTVTPYRSAIMDRVSPHCTMCTVSPEAPGAASAPAGNNSILATTRTPILRMNTLDMLYLLTTNLRGRYQTATVVLPLGLVALP